MKKAFIEITSGFVFLVLATLGLYGIAAQESLSPDELGVMKQGGLLIWSLVMLTLAGYSFQGTYRVLAQHHRAG